MALIRDPGIVLRTEILKIVGKNSLEAYGNVNKIITSFLCGRKKGFTEKTGRDPGKITESVTSPVR